MPTKPNKAGKQQPYVPAGHGDPSGEYAENNTGSNKNYASPDDVKRQLGYTPEKKVESNTPKDVVNKLNGKNEPTPAEEKKLKEMGINVDSSKNDKFEFKGIFSLKGLKNKDIEKITEAFSKTLNDFEFLKDTLVSFGTKAGIENEVERRFNEFSKTEEYLKQIEIYGNKLKKWNIGKEFSIQEIERLFKQNYFNENIHLGKGRFWGVCGTLVDNNTKSWIQLKNVDYEKIKFSNDIAMIKNGYPNNTGASFEATTYHELGHAVANYMLNGRNYLGFVHDYNDSKTEDEIRQIKKKYNFPISEYGKQSFSEYFAECFASHYVDGTNKQAEEVFNYIFNKYKNK